MIHDDGKLTLEPAGERERTMRRPDGLRPALHSVSGHHLGWGRSGRGGGAPPSGTGWWGGAHPSGTASD